MTNDDSTKIAIHLPGEWALKKLLGPTLDTLGEDINKIYQIGRDKIIDAAKRKVVNIEDGASANLRVSRDVFWSGAFTDEEICAEYFGGILASSRSQDGKDDSGIFYVDLIKSLSSSQLRLHYLAYRSLNKLFVRSPRRELNVGMSTELEQIQLYFALLELARTKINADIDFEALYRKGLLHSYGTTTHNLTEGQHLLYVVVTPTTLGIQVFAVANNMLANWRGYTTEDFGDFKDIPTPKYSAFTLQQLVEQVTLGSGKPEGK